MNGTATQIEIGGRTVRLGDEMEVEYTMGRCVKGQRIHGVVVELWSSEDAYPQARLSCGWSFHDHDKIIAHTVKYEKKTENKVP